MLRIWGRRDAFNVQKVLWLIDELELAHEHVQLGGSFGGLDEPAFVVGALQMVEQSYFHFSVAVETAPCLACRRACPAPIHDTIATELHGARRRRMRVISSPALCESSRAKRATWS